MKRWFVWIALGLFHASAFAQAPVFSIQCPGMVSKGDTVIAVVPTGLVPANQAYQYQWSALDPTTGLNTSIASLSGVQGNTTMTFRAVTPGRFNLICTYGTTTPVTKTIDILPDPNLQIVVPTILTKGAQGITAEIIEPSGGCPNLRYEWLPTPGIRLSSGSNTSRLTFEVENSVTTYTTLKAKVTNPAGKIFPIATSTNIQLLDAPKSTITLQSSLVTTGDTHLKASAPMGTGIKYDWAVDGGMIDFNNGGYYVYFTATGIGDLKLTCKATNTAGTSSVTTATVQVLPKPNADFLISSIGNINTASAIAPQAGTSYFWEFSPGAGSAVMLEGQGTPQVKYYPVVSGVAPFAVSLTATNTAGGKAIQSHNSNPQPAAGDIFINETGFPLIRGCTYTASTGNAISVLGSSVAFTWTIVQVKKEFGIEIEIKNTYKTKGLDGYHIPISIVGDPSTELKMSCLEEYSSGGSFSHSGTRRIIPSADARIAAPSKITIGIPFSYSAPEPQNYYTDWELTLPNGSKMNPYRTYADGVSTITVPAGYPTGDATLKATSMTRSLRDSSDTKTVSIKILPAPSIFSITVDAGFARKKGSETSVFNVSRGASSRITTIFSGGTGSINQTNSTSQIGTVLSGQTYETSPILSETILELTVTNEAGASVKQSITLIPVAPDIKIRFITINQGVERYLNAQDQIDGTYNNSTFPQDFWKAQTWKKDVPLIAGRPARFTVHVLSQGGTAIPFGTGATAKNTLSLVLTNNGVETVIPMKTATFSPPTVGTSFGETDGTKVAQFDVMEPAYPLTLLNEQTMMSIRVTLDPALGIDPLKGVDNPYRDPVSLGLKYMPKMDVHLVSIDYTYRNNGNLRTVGMTNAELDAIAVRIGLLNSIKALFPVSYVDVTGQPMVAVRANPLGISAGWNEETVGWASPGASVWRGPFYTGASIDENNMEWMLTELKHQPWTDINLLSAWPQYETVMGPYYGTQNNTYVLGVVRSITAHTRPSTLNTSFNPGFSHRGQHWAVTLADVDENGGSVTDTKAATTAAHELGHTNGAAHAPCQAWEALDPMWGYSPTPTDKIPVSPLCLAPAYGFGGIGVTGLSFGSLSWRSLPIVQTDKDLMSYAPASTRWISDYNFTVLFRQQKNNKQYIEVVIP